VLTLNGARLSGPPSKRARAGLARTFQHPHLALDLSVAENLLLGRAAVRMRTPLQMISGAIAGFVNPRPVADRVAVEALAEEVNITRLDRAGKDLSLGEQRLVEVARALGQDPTVMLLDEPFAGADANGIAGIIEAVRIVQRRGNGVILVDHNIDLVSALVDRVMLLNQGRVAFDGDPQACLSSKEMQLVYFGVEDDSDEH
jgi:branched-chain amino acid transport system ATP-binding protein